MTNAAAFPYALLFTITTTSVTIVQIYGISPSEIRKNSRPLFLAPYLTDAGMINQALRLSQVNLFPGVIAYSGYFTVNARTRNDLFFLFMRAQMENHTKAPLVLSLKGGPGISSLFGLYLETGPFGFGPTGRIFKRCHTLQRDMNVLYLDLPAGSGYSLVNYEGYATKLEDMNEDIDAFFDKFFRLFPEYARSPLYLIGEHYGGRAAVTIGSHLLGNRNVNFKGVVVGNTFLGPLIDVINPSDFLYSVKMLDVKGRDILQHYFDQAKNLIAKGQTQEVLDLLLRTVAESRLEPWSSTFQSLTGYDYQASVLYDQIPPEFEMYATYANSTEFKKAIHVGDGAVMDWTRDEVSSSLVPGDFNRDVTDSLINLVRSGKKVTFFGGQLNTLLTAANLERYAESALKENGMGSLGDPLPWYNADVVGQTKIAGYVRAMRNFKFVVLARAGQHAAFDESPNYCDMVRRVVFDRSFS